MMSHVTHIDIDSGVDMSFFVYRGMNITVKLLQKSYLNSIFIHIINPNP